MKTKSRQADPIYSCLKSKGAIIASSIFSAHVKMRAFLWNKMNGIVISFRRIDINIAFSSRQTFDFAFNWVPPFQRLPLGHILSVGCSLFINRADIFLLNDTPSKKFR